MILSQWTPIRMLQHNDISEMRNHALLDMVRSMMSHANLLKMFWDYALDITSYTPNRIPSNSVESTSYEIWYEKRSSLSHLRVWSYYVYMKHNKSDKLGARSDKCNFVGYPK